MLLEGYPEKVTKIGFYFHFALSNRSTVDLVERRLSKGVFQRFSGGCFRTGTDQTTEFAMRTGNNRKVIDPSLQETHESPLRYLSHYKRNVYRRIRHRSRSNRDALIYELKPISVSNISLN